MADMCDDDDEKYEEVDLEDDGGIPKWASRSSSSSRQKSASCSDETANGVESRPHPQAVMASILKGDKPAAVQRSMSMKATPQPLPRSPITAEVDVPPNLPPPNARKVRPPAPPPTYLKSRSATVPDFSKIPPKPGAKVRRIIKPKLEDSFIIEKEEYTPDEFVSKFSDRFPLHVRVSKGFYGNSETTSVSEGDTFNIHFIKKTKVVHIEDGVGRAFKITLNSAIQFGFLFDPHGKRDEALKGHMYNKVSDLLPLKTLPKVLRASVGWWSGSADSTVDSHELFIVKGWKRKLQKKLLKVYNPVTKTKKELPEACECKFSTAPYDNRLYLPDIIEHIHQPFPCGAVLYMNMDSIRDANVPTYLTSSVVQLNGTSTNTTLVASGSCARISFNNTDIPMVEIPYSLDIEFQVMYPKEQKDTERLYQTTRDLLNNMANAKTRSGYVICPLRNDHKSEAQSALYSFVKEGHEMAGVDFVKPSAIYANTSDVSSVPPPTRTSASSSPQKQSIVKLDSLYSDINGSLEIKTLEEKTAKLETSLSAVETKMSSLGGVEEAVIKLTRDVTSTKADLIRTDSRAMRAMEDAGKARTEIEELRAMVKHLKKTCASLQNKMDTARQAPPNYALPPTPTTPMSPTYDAITKSSSVTSSASGVSTTESAYSTIDEATCETNREFLSSLDFVHVLTLLECMGLKKHHEAFMEERVNGEILLECDDSVLQDELKVTSKIQRSRLMKLIHGKYSAKKILQGEDPYVYARPK